MNGASQDIVLAGSFFRTPIEPSDPVIRERTIKPAITIAIVNCVSCGRIPIRAITSAEKSYCRNSMIAEPVPAMRGKTLIAVSRAFG